MKCDICEKEVTTARIVPLVGHVCKNESCSEKGNELYHEEIERLRNLDVFCEGEPYTTKEFIEIVLHIAISMVDTWEKMAKEGTDEKSAEIRQALEDQPMIYRNPFNVQLCIVERVLDELCKKVPKYIDMEYNRGHARLFSSGTFQFKQPINRQIVIEALVAADVLEEK